MNCICLIIIVILAVSLVSLSVKYKKLKNTFRNHKKTLRGILKTINSVRYGNLFERVDDSSYILLPNFSESVNRMIESIVDRENMIKEYQYDLNKKIEALKEIEQIKEDFVATLTHDLKVPIIAEKNMLNFLMENRFGELNDNQKEAVLHLKNSNKELVELVEILLETYKLNETNIVLNKERIDVNEFLNSVLDEMKPIADSGSQTLRLHSEYNDSIEADKIYLRRTLKNLILNGLSFSEPNGNVDININNDSKNLYIAITNYGPSIDKQEIEHIFDKYYSSAKKFRKVGTGLGLYLSNKIVRAHKGQINVESNDEKTSFIIQLPFS